MIRLSTDNEEKMEISTETGSIGWGEYESGDYARYFETTDGNKHAYVVDASVTPDQAPDSVVLQDDAGNRYIVEVEEAASLAKLSLEDKDSYLKLKASDADPIKSNKDLNKIVHDITKQVASGDTYKKNAEQYYLMISNILFYDQSVYDYFKSQFPELFK